MNKKYLILFLLFFIMGMTMGTASASHTYHMAGYTFSISNSKYNDVQNFKDDATNPFFKVKTNKYKTVKVPKYKNKKVTKYKWKYKKVKAWRYDTIWDTVKTYKIPNKYKSWKYVKDISKTSSNGQYEYGYHVFKKKVAYKTTKKVKTGYKKVKLRVYAVSGVARTPFVEFRAIGHGLDYPTDFARYSL